MTRDEMIEKLVKHIAPKLDIWEAAAAVLDLCGPKPLVWRVEPRHGWKVGVAYAGPDAHIIRKDEGWNFKGNVYPSLEAAQAAAQAHADAEHWRNTRMGDV